MITDAITALESDGYKFAHFAWSHAPSGDYGTWSEETGNEFTSNGAVSEQVMSGWLDYFTRDDTGAVQTAIQSAMSQAGVVWHLDNVMYENDSGFLHYTWEYFESGE